MIFNYFSVYSKFQMILCVFALFLFLGAYLWIRIYIITFVL